MLRNSKSRTGWRIVKFGDVVRNVNETERNPLEAGLDRYIGLEHIEPENLHIKSWGDLTTDEVSFTKRFRKGQVLFGKRRAYQRKVAVAEFDGICSSDILTFEPKDDALLPELLPFLVQSDGFFEHALGTSSGSLSPRTRWSQLQDYEFPLPPKDEQRRIAEMLWAADECVDAYRQVGTRTSDFKFLVASHLWRNGIGASNFKDTSLGTLPAHWTVKPLAEETVMSAYGPRFPATQYAEMGNVQTVRTTDFDRRGGLTLDAAPYTTLSEDTIAKHRLERGDFLLSRSGEYAGLTATFPETDRCVVAAAFLIRFKLKPTLLSEYLVHLIYSDFGDLYVLPLATGSAQPNISGSQMLATKIPVPPLNEQLRIVQILDDIELARQQAENHLKKIDELRRNLFATLVSPVGI